MVVQMTRERCGDGHCEESKNGITYHHVKDEKDIEDVKNRVLLFTAKWCLPCNTFKEKLRNCERSGKTPINLFIVDVEEARGIAIKYGVNRVPTAVFVKNGNADEEATERMIGSDRGVEGFEEMISAAFGRG